MVIRLLARFYCFSNSIYLLTITFKFLLYEQEKND